MLRVLCLTACCLFSVVVTAGQVREYWIAAEKVRWNYAPSGLNKVMQAKGLGPWGERLVYDKYRYIQYQDGSYKKRVVQPEWMGILGPQIRAEEGDEVLVHFYNRADKPLSMHPHGLRYDPQNDGALFDASAKYSASSVAPGARFTYRWSVNETAAPGPADGSSVVWVYHSHVDSVTEIYDGLIGTIVVTRKGFARSSSDPRPSDVDQEFTSLFMVFDEEGGEEGGLMHAMNGYIFGNLSGYKVKQGEKVRWHLVGMGSEVDLHTAHWHGQTVLNHGRRTDVIELLPSSMTSVDMLADNPGTWLYHCHVTDHIAAGMSTLWSVEPLYAE